MSEHVEELKAKVKERFNITDLGQLRKHLSVNYEEVTDKYGDYVEMRNIERNSLAIMKKCLTKKSR